MIVVRIFRHSPAIEQFIHDDEAHAVAKVEELRSRRIVSSTNSVHAKLLERLQAALPRAQRHGGAERARVVMKTDALYFKVAAVEPETRVSIEVKLTNAKGHHLVVDSCLSVTQPNDGAI